MDRGRTHGSRVPPRTWRRPMPRARCTTPLVGCPRYTVREREKVKEDGRVVSTLTIISNEFP